MKPLILVDLQAVYELYDEVSCDEAELFHASAKLSFSALLGDISKFLNERHLTDFELKFFADPEYAVVLRAMLDGSTEPQIFSQLPAEAEIVVGNSCSDRGFHRLRVRDVLKRNEVAAYLDGKGVPVLAVSQDQTFLGSLNANRLRVSHLGELELPSSLNQLSSSVHLLYDTDNSLLLRFITYAANSAPVLNPFLLDFILQIRNQEDFDIDFQQITTRHQAQDFVGEREDYISDYSFRFVGHCSGERVLAAMRAWLSGQRVREEELARYNILYTNGELKLRILYSKYQAMPAEQRPRHLILVDDNPEELSSADAQAFCQAFVGLNMTVHLVRVRQQGELLPGWDVSLNLFLESCRCAVGESMLLSTGVTLFIGLPPTVFEETDTQLAANP